MLSTTLLYYCLVSECVSRRVCDLIGLTLSDPVESSSTWKYLATLRRRIVVDNIMHLPLAATTQLLGSSMASDKAWTLDDSLLSSKHVSHRALSEISPAHDLRK
jgi:hypothetical protein